LDLAALCAQHTEAVRGRLRRFGVQGQDLDDLVHEVFLVLHGISLAARWLAEKHPQHTNVGAAALIEAAERLRTSG
jgi:hypothetical protein